jgi:hypothetical protein
MGIGHATAMKCTYMEVSFTMPHENTWFLITWNELHTIREGLHTLEKHNPVTGSQYLGEIRSILNEVQDRQP